MDYTGKSPYRKVPNEFKTDIYQYYYQYNTWGVCFYHIPEFVFILCCLVYACVYYDMLITRCKGKCTAVKLLMISVRGNSRVKVQSNLMFVNIIGNI